MCFGVGAGHFGDGRKSNNGMHTGREERGFRAQDLGLLALDARRVMPGLRHASPKIGSRVALCEVQKAAARIE